MMSANLKYYLAFSHFLGIGPVRFDKLINHYKSVKNAYEAPGKEITQIIGPIIGENFITFRNKFDPEKKIEELAKSNIYIITREDKLYPQQLHNISDPPICLYLRGNPDLLKQPEEKIFAIVGTRRPTTYGEEVARIFSRALSQAGLTLASGMALGIDSIAHYQALDTKGETIAVLGCGVDIIYPPSNHKLYEKIITSGSCIISEFPPGQTVMKGLFIARNRIISALSRAVLVVEGAADSGSLITARHAADQGKDVFAPPAPITSIYSKAPNSLLKKGAILAISVDDILQELNIQYPKQQKKLIDLSSVEKKVIDHLQKEPADTNQLAKSLNINITEALTTITKLELKEAVKRTSDGKYQLVHL